MTIPKDILSAATKALSEVDGVGGVWAPVSALSAQQVRERRRDIIAHAILAERERAEKRAEKLEAALAKMDFATDLSESLRNRYAEAIALLRAKEEQ